MTASGRTNAKARAALILGLGSLVLAWGIGFLIGIPAILFGQAAKRDIHLSGGAERGRGMATTGIVTGIIGTLVSVTVAVWAGSGLWAEWKEQPQRKWVAPSAAPTPDAGGLKAFYAQKLTWTDCGQGKCTEVKVPVDYDDPTGPTVLIAAKVIPATGAGGRSLFLNPGGPGASSIDFAEYLAGRFSADVRRKYDLVNVDPRGVGESSPIDCASKAQFLAWAASDPDPDTPAEVEEFREAHRAFGEGCEQRSGALAAHVSTEEVVRDFDVVRALLGQQKFDWFGFSYGTAIGATYATLFPDRVGRMVLDGPFDPTESVLDGARSQAVGFNRALSAYIKDCTSRFRCPLGRDPDKAMRRIANLFASLDKHPLRTDDPNRTLTQGYAFYGIAEPLYSKSTWISLTNAFDAAFQGDGSVLARLADSYFEQVNGEAFVAISCLDVRDHPTIADVEEAEDDFVKVSPVFGRGLAWGALFCTDWPIKAEHPQVPITSGTKAPIVVVGTTGDPATPFESAKTLTKKLGTGVLLTRVGDGHTAYGSGNSCIDDAVDRYLVTGKPPAEGTVCR